MTTTLICIQVQGAEHDIAHYIHRLHTVPADNLTGWTLWTQGPHIVDAETSTDDAYDTGYRDALEAHFQGDDR